MGRRPPSEQWLPRWQSVIPAPLYFSSPHLYTSLFFSLLLCTYITSSLFFCALLISVLLSSSHLSISNLLIFVLQCVSRICNSYLFISLLLIISFLSNLQQKRKGKPGCRTVSAQNCICASSPNANGRVAWSLFWY